MFLRCFKFLHFNNLFIRSLCNAFRVSGTRIYWNSLRTRNSNSFNLAFLFNVIISSEIVKQFGYKNETKCVITEQSIDCIEIYFYIISTKKITVSLIALEQRIAFIALDLNLDRPDQFSRSLPRFPSPPSPPCVIKELFLAIIVVYVARYIFRLQCVD